MLVSNEIVEQVLRKIPGYDPFLTAGEAWLDHDAAVRAINFFPERLKHVEGNMRGEPFILRPWQAAIVGNLFGWKRCDDAGRVVRRYRKALIYVPRGNGKTPIASGIVLYAFYEDHEPGAQCYLAAGQKEQAGFLFRNASGMVEQDTVLFRRTIIQGGDQHRQLKLKADRLSFCKVIPADAAGQHGGIPHISVVDELHVQQNRDLLDVFETGMSKKVRSQPLLVMITTADYDRESICNEMHKYASGVRDGVVPDPYFLPVIYEAKPEDDWTKEETWEKANPNLDVSVSRESLRDLCKKAVEIPSSQNSFLRLHLNIKTQTDVKWIPLELWDRGSEWVDEEKFVGRDCWIGIDFGFRDDYAALVAVYEIDGKIVWRPRFWIPKDGKRKKAAEPTATFIAEGLVTVTDGNATDIEAIYAGVEEIASESQVVEIAIDPNNARKQGQDLLAKGYKVVDFYQNKRNYNEPCRILETALKENRILHGGNKVLRWMANNVQVETNGLDQIMPTKAKSTEKIDGMTAGLMAIGRMIYKPVEQELKATDII